MLLKLDWYLESPIDFEHKNYVLLDYVQKVDESYKDHLLSPYLIWNEHLVDELYRFDLNRKSFLKTIEQTTLTVKDGRLAVVRNYIPDSDQIKTILEIIEYSIPILESKIKLGYNLLKRYPQILW